MGGATGCHQPLIMGERVGRNNFDHHHHCHHHHRHHHHHLHHRVRKTTIYKASSLPRNSHHRHDNHHDLITNRNDNISYNVHPDCPFPKAEEFWQQAMWWKVKGAPNGRADPFCLLDPPRPTLLIMHRPWHMIFVKCGNFVIIVILFHIS